MNTNITIPFAKPSITNDEIDAVIKVLKSGWLTTGSEAIAFEKEFINFLNVQKLQALAVQSCTAGLHLAFNALKIDARHSVIASPLTFISTVSMAIHCGAHIEFIDCAPGSLYPNAESVDKLPKHERQKVIILVPLAGYHPHYEQLFEIATQRQIYTLEDAAHAFPARINIKNTYHPYGTLANIGVYSFYANKTITTGEGGMVVSKNPELSQAMMLLRNHGMDKLTWNRYTDSPSKFSYDIIVPGYKYNMPDILATIGRAQLQRANALHKKRVNIAKRYFDRLSNRDYWTLPETPVNLHDHAWHLFIIQINHPRLSRDDFMRLLQEKGIGTSVHYKPLHLMSFFQKNYGFTPYSFPNAFEVFQKILSLPLYPDLEEETLDFICNTIIEIGDNN